MILKRNLDLQKWITNTENGNCIIKYKNTFSYFWTLKSELKIMNIMHFIVYNTYRGKMTGNNGTQAGEGV